MSTHAVDVLLEWPNGAQGGAGVAGWQSSMQHGFEPEKNENKDLALHGFSLPWY